MMENLMRRTLLPLSIVLAAALPVAADPPLADKAFEPLVASGLIDKFQTLDGWEIMPGGVERFDDTWALGGDWMLQALAMQIEPGETTPELYFEDVDVTTGKSISINMEVLALFLSDDLNLKTASGETVGHVLLQGTPDEIEKACGLMNSHVSGMAESTTFLENGEIIGNIDGFKTRIQMGMRDDVCFMNTIVQTAGIDLTTSDGRITEIDFISITSEGPVLDPSLRSSSVRVGGFSTVRNGEVKEVKDVLTTISGELNAKISGSLFKLVSGDPTGIHETMDAIAAAVDPS
jgi:hypothetical protein